MDELVVATAARECAQLFLTIKNLEHDSIIVCQSAHDGEIDRDKIAEAALVQIFNQHGEARGAFQRMRDEMLHFFNGALECRELGVEDIRWLALPFIHDCKKRCDVGCIASFRMQKIHPCLAVAESQNEIGGAESELAQEIDEQREKLGVGSGRCIADQIAVELKEFPKPAALLFFIPKKRCDGEPLDRFAKFPLSGSDHAGKRGSHLGAHGDMATAFVLKIEELSDEFAPAFFLI